MARPSWAMAGAPAYLTAASKSGNTTCLVGLTEEGDVVFELPIPSRGHAAAAHPFRAEAVAFARRPGRFAVVLDCATGTEIARLDSPEGRHFYGHGAFTADGSLLLTTENAYDVPDGRLGVWDAEDGYKRIGELPSGGIGPHEMIRLADGSFAVANGGMQTHPDFERSVLNIPTMRPNLTYLDAAGAIVDQVTPPEDMRLNSIRHIAADATGRVVIALQWQGNPLTAVPLMASHRRGEELAFFDHPETVRLKQYAGSIAISSDGAEIAMTGPKGGHVLFFDGATGCPDQRPRLARGQRGRAVRGTVRDYPRRRPARGRCRERQHGRDWRRLQLGQPSGLDPAKLKQKGAAAPFVMQTGCRGSRLWTGTAPAAG